MRWPLSCVNSTLDCPLSTVVTVEVQPISGSTGQPIALRRSAKLLQILPKPRIGLIRRDGLLMTRSVNLECVELEYLKATLLSSNTHISPVSLRHNIRP